MWRHWPSQHSGRVAPRSAPSSWERLLLLPLILQPLPSKPPLLCGPRVEEAGRMGLVILRVPSVTDPPPIRKRSYTGQERLYPVASLAGSQAQMQLRHNHMRALDSMVDSCPPTLKAEQEYRGEGTQAQNILASSDTANRRNTASCIDLIFSSL